MRWPGHIKYLDENKNAHKILDWNPQGNILRGNTGIEG